MFFFFFRKKFSLFFRNVYIIKYDHIHPHCHLIELSPYSHTPNLRMPSSLVIGADAAEMHNRHWKISPRLSTLPPSSIEIFMCVMSGLPAGVTVYHLGTLPIDGWKGLWGLRKWNHHDRLSLCKCWEPTEVLWKNR